MITLQNIHCIGDRANKVVLDIFERILIEESEKTGETVHAIADRRRPRIEHAQIMQLEDLERAGRLGGVWFLGSYTLYYSCYTVLVIASVQPTHA